MKPLDWVSQMNHDSKEQSPNRLTSGLAVTWEPADVGLDGKPLWKATMSDGKTERTIFIQQVDKDAFSEDGETIEKAQTMLKNWWDSVGEENEEK